MPLVEIHKFCYIINELKYHKFGIDYRIRHGAIIFSQLFGSEDYSVFGKPHIFHASPANDRKSVFLPWRIFCLAVILAFAFGGAGQTGPVQAAPVQGPTIFSFDISTSELPDPICLPQTHNIKVTTHVDRVVELDGEYVRLYGWGGPLEVSVAASVDDPGIATLRPPIRSISPVMTDLGGLTQDDDIFQLDTHKEGSTTLAFEATVREGENGGDLIFPKFLLPINVEKCKFLITLIYTLHYEAQKVSGYQSGIATIPLAEGDTEGKLEGSGSFVIHDTISLAGPAAEQFSDAVSKVQVTGTLGQSGILNLGFKFDKATRIGDAQTQLLSFTNPLAGDVASLLGLSEVSFYNPPDTITRNTPFGGFLTIVVKLLQ